MNFIQLVLKQMRQRALSTWLTMLSVLLGVALAVAIMILQRGAGKLFGQTDYGFNVLIGAKGSPLQLTLNTVYHLDRSPGNIPYWLYEQLTTDRRYRPMVKIAVPIAVGDTYQGHRIVATTTQYFGYDEQGNPLPGENAMEYRPGKRHQIAFGRMFHPRKFEAIIGADIPRLTGLNVGASFQATHGTPVSERTADVHEQSWTVVGVLQPTFTAADRVIYIPLTTFYTIQEHEQALEAIAQLQRRSPAPATEHAPDNDHRKDHQAPASSHAEAAEQDPDNRAFHTPGGEDHAGHDEHYVLNPDGTIELKIPKDQMMISAILVKTRPGGANVQGLMWEINNQNVAAAVNPAQVMSEFFRTFLEPSSRMLQAVATLVTIVAGVGILVSIYNSIAARRKEIAILRALGATRMRILSLICAEAAMIGLIGAVLGIMAGHLVGAGGSIYLQRLVGEGFDWLAIRADEAIYLLAVVVLALAAGLVPALKAYRTPVATNLVAE